MNILDALCPLSRCFGDKDLWATCRGEKCAVFRKLKPDASHPSFIAAVKREEACLAQDDKTGKPASAFHEQAVANVGKDPEAYGVDVSDVGYCGLGGGL